MMFQIFIFTYVHVCLCVYATCVYVLVPMWVKRGQAARVYESPNRNSELNYIP